MKRSPLNVQGAARIIAEFVADHPERVAPFLDDGLDVQIEGKTISVRCATCRAPLVVDVAPKKAEVHAHEQAARDLALKNALRNPCCDRWR